MVNPQPEITPDLRRFGLLLCAASTLFAIGALAVLIGWLV